MATGLTQLEIVTALTGAATVFFGWYSLQRVYFRFKTAAIDVVDTMTLHLIPDGLSAVLALASCLVFISGLMAIRTIERFEGVPQLEVIQVFEVADVRAGTPTVLAYPGSQANARVGARPDAVVFGENDKFVAVVEVARFAPWLSFLGQRDIARLVGTGSETPAGSPEFGWLQRICLRGVDRREVTPPAPVNAGEVYVLTRDPAGTEIVLRLASK